MMTEAPEWKCEFCNSPGVPLYDLYLGEKRGSMVRCEKCASCQIETPFPEADVYDSFENSHFSTEPWEIHKAQLLAEDYYRKVKPYYVKRLKDAYEISCLEFGSKYGFFSLKLRWKDGLYVDVVEPNKAYRQFYDERLHNHPGHVAKSLKEFGPRPKYTNIYSFHVVEHFQRLSGFLTDIVPRLHPGGRLVMLTPNASSKSFLALGERWGWACPTQHFQFLSTKIPPEYFAKFGLKVVECKDVAPAPIHYPSVAHSKLHGIRLHRGEPFTGAGKLASKVMTAAATAFAQNRWGITLLPIERTLTAGRSPKDELLLVLEKVA
ncbi:MAG: hypothetical protein JWN51_3518 [Phycisphaerales bacterium]|nr:hypothetical protein [Phycisphaerales bacterium]